MPTRLFAPAVLAALLALPLSAEPLKVSGEVTAPGDAAVRVELFPLEPSFQERLRELAGEPLRPLASVPVRAGGSFEIQAPDRGLYRLVVRAEGFVPHELPLGPLVEETELPAVELERASKLAPAESGPRQALRPDGPAAAFAEVRDEQGRPVGGALVSWNASPLGVTGPDGRLGLPVFEQAGTLSAEHANGAWVGTRLFPGEPKAGQPVHLVLAPPRITAGRVLETGSRTPLAGALVWSDPRWAAKTGADGSFRISTAGSGGRMLVAAAPGHLPTTQVLQNGDSSLEALTILLEPAGILAGTVADSEGKPLAGVEVRAHPIDPFLGGPSSDTPHVARSRTDGSFRLSGLSRREPYEVAARKDGFAPSSVQGSVGDPGESPPLLRIVLGRGATVRGRVVDDQGKPVAGASLGLWRTQADDLLGFSPRQGSVPFRIESGPSGDIRFDHVDAGTFLLEGRRKGFSPALREGIEVPAGVKEVDLGELRLEAGAALAGQVTNRQGAPLAGAEIRFLPEDSNFALTLGEIELEPAFTGPDGRFRIEDLPRGERLVLYVRHSVYATRQILGVEVPPSQPLRVELQRAQILTGRVVGPRGEPVADAGIERVEDVELGSVAWILRTLYETPARTDAMGRFRIGDLGPGNVDLRVWADGYLEKRLERIEVPEDREAPALTIALQPGAVLQGRVLKTDGTPVAGAQVAVETPEGTLAGMATTDGEGRYRINGLGTGRQSVQAQIADRPPLVVSTEVRPGVNDLDLTIQGGGVNVAGRVVSPDGSPVPGATLTLRSIEKGKEQVFTTESIFDGSFRFVGVVDGVYRLRGFGGGFAGAILPWKLFVAGKPLQGLQLRLARGATLTGRILGLTPQEAKGVEVFAISDQGFTPTVGLTPEGTYRIPNLSPGTWDVTAETRDARVAEGSVTIGPGLEDATLDLDFSKPQEAQEEPRDEDLPPPR